MKELGVEEESLHRGLASDIRALGQAVEVLLYGERMKWLASELAGMSITARSFRSQDEMADAMKGRLRPGDAVLLKGSRSMRMEKVWERLKDQSSDAVR